MNKVKDAQSRALKAVNFELVSVYRDIGQIIHEKQSTAEWGASIVERLAKDLKNRFPGVKGFSPRNLWRMKDFYLSYCENEKLSALLTEISWTHNVAILTKCQDRFQIWNCWYAKQSICSNWTLSVKFFSMTSAIPETTILYIRHGEVPGNDPHSPEYSYTSCRTNPSLTDKGCLQAKAVADKLVQMQEEGKIGKITAIYSSTLSRARETAQESATRLGLEIEVRHELREIDWGIASGRRVQDMTAQWGDVEKRVKGQYPDRKIRWDYVPVFPEAEKLNQLLARTTAELQKIAGQHPGETILVFGHGRTLKTLIRASDLEGKGKIPYPSNGGITEFQCSSEKGVRFIRILSARTS